MNAKDRDSTSHMVPAPALSLAPGRDQLLVRVHLEPSKAPHIQSASASVGGREVASACAFNAGF
jgi:hypothetical protein